MTYSEAFTYSTIIGGGSAAVILFVRGVLERRPFWTRRSWFRFGGAFAAALLVALTGLLMTMALDNGLFRSTPNYRHLFIVANLAVMAIGGGSLGLLLWVFAAGEPDRQFRFTRSLRNLLRYRTRALPGKEPDFLQQPVSSLLRESPAEKERPR